MSPRPKPSLDDDISKGFLRAAAELIDDYLQTGPRHLKYPAALAWLRIDDVIDIAKKYGHTASKTAFYHRWRDRDQFLCDAVTFCLDRAETADTPRQRAEQASRRMRLRAAAE